MAVNQSNTDTNLFTGVDLRAFWETLRLRWWIIPAVLTVSVGFLWAQASELRIEPEYYAVTQIYEARDPTAILTSVGIDPTSVRAFPDTANQLRILQSESVRTEIATAIGRDVNVGITRSGPSFSLIETLESDGQSSFLFRSAGTPTYTFSCTETERLACERAIDAYVQKAVELRKSSLVAGLSDMQEVLSALRQSSDNQDFEVKIAALELLRNRLDVSFLNIDSRSEVIGTTVTSVRRSTYVFGVAASVIVSLLILLQLTISDRKIRSSRQVVNEIGGSAFIGGVSATPRSDHDLLAAVSLQQACARSEAKHITFVPISSSPKIEPLERLAAMCGIPYLITKPFLELTVPEMVDRNSDEISIVVVQRNRDLRQHLLTSVAALRRSEQKFGGVLMLD